MKILPHYYCALISILVFSYLSRAFHCLLLNVSYFAEVFFFFGLKVSLSVMLIVRQISIYVRGSEEDNMNI